MQVERAAGAADDSIITWFWEAAEQLTAEEQRLLLQFWSGSDSVPIEVGGGVAVSIIGWMGRAPIMVCIPSGPCRPQRFPEFQMLSSCGRPNGTHQACVWACMHTDANTHALDTHQVRFPSGL